MLWYVLSYGWNLMHSALCSGGRGERMRRQSGEARQGSCTACGQIQWQRQIFCKIHMADSDHITLKWEEAYFVTYCGNWHTGYNFFFLWFPIIWTLNTVLGVLFCHGEIFVTMITKESKKNWINEIGINLNL